MNDLELVAEWVGWADHMRANGDLRWLGSIRMHGPLLTRHFEKRKTAFYSPENRGSRPTLPHSSIEHHGDLDDNRLHLSRRYGTQDEKLCFVSLDDYGSLQTREREIGHWDVRHMHITRNYQEVRPIPIDRPLRWPTKEGWEPRGGY